MEYLVTWEMTIEADTPEEAARKALEIHRDPESIATVFTVTEFDGGFGVVEVDLDA